MCSPIALGAGQALASTVGSVGRFQAEQKQTSLVNQGRADQYRQQLLARDLKYKTNLSTYNARLADYVANIREKYRAYGSAIQDSQTQLNEQYRAANVLSLNQAMAANSAAGRSAARGVAGQSSAQQYQAIMAGLGRNEALTMDNLLRARYANIRGNERLRDSLMSAQNRAYNQIGAPPIPGIAPPKPVFSQGPSAFGLVTDIGSGVLGGVTSAYGMADGSNLNKFKPS